MQKSLTSVAANEQLYAFRFDDAPRYWIVLWNKTPDCHTDGARSNSKLINQMLNESLKEETRREMLDDRFLYQDKK